MPITARLSHTLHRTLGDDAATDLVDWMSNVDAQRAELREFNELNFARIDSRFQQIDSRINETRHELRAEIAELRQEMRVGFAGVDSKIDRRFADLLKWSFLFWCGTFAAAVFWHR